MKQLLFYLLLLPALCFAQVPDPLPNTYVNDLASVLTTDQVKSINERIYAIEKKSSVQIAVILMNDLPANMEIGDYTLQVGRKWHVGNARNGLVYAAAINQRKMRLEVASALQGDIPDVTALSITDAMKPFFRQKDYYGGINKLLDGIDAQVDPVKKEQLKLLQAEQDKKDEQFKEVAINVMLWLLVVVIIGLIAWFSYFRPRLKKKREEEAEREKERYKNLGSVAGVPPLLAGIMAGTLGMAAMSAAKRKREERETDTYIPPSPSHDHYSPPPTKKDDDNYGNWGSGSSDSGSSSSGFDGGGADNNW